ncbi:MFS transporter [Cellulomonas chitinilytica]|uniref:MFS transporter n=1 Tax=Cellulomonas chitinilytica TaxID=398759 RepID=A0A919P3Z9_9CELL|nr:MFS transporter [Cellulomonas chitinilytica]GIG22285.1 MFS transporter [Cellulomonas chitinilytica]
MTDRQTRLALWCCLGAGFATLVDSAVLGFAVPSLSEQLGASTAQVQWLLASYSLTFGLGLVPGGRLGDAYGRRGLFVAGLVVFVVGGSVAAVAGGMWWVVGGRLVQGFGAGLISAQVLGIIQDLFTGPRRVRALAAYTSAGAAAALVGPLSAATLLALLPAGWGWRAVLLINVPFAVTTLVLALRFVPRAPRRGTRLDLDVPAVVLLGALAVLVTLPVIDPGARPSVWGTAAVAVPVLVVVLVVWERRYARRGRVALFAPALVRQPGFVTGNAVALLWFGSVVAHSTVVTLFLIQGAHVPALAVAVVLLPSAASRVVSSSLAARVFDRRGSRLVPAALLVHVVALAGLAAAVARGSDGVPLLVVVAVVEVLMGFASGLVEPPLRAVTLGFAPAGFHGVAASFLQLTQRLSATFCVAVASGLLLRGPDAEVTSSSFVVSLLFCGVLLVLAAGVGSTRWLHGGPRTTGRTDASADLAPVHGPPDGADAAGADTPAQIPVG